jgi:hypothetical protein
MIFYGATERTVAVGCGRPVGSFRAAAAKGKDGSGAIVIARYSHDNNVTDTARVTLIVPGAPLAKARCLLTDAVRTFTEVPLETDDDGNYLIRMQPNSFAVVEW